MTCEACDAFGADAAESKLALVILALNTTRAY